MIDIKEQLQEMYQQYDEAATMIKIKQSQIPQGYLESKRKHDHYEYYWHNHPFTAPDGARYIKKSEIIYAQQLAEKSYYKKIEKACAEQQKVLSACIQKLNPEALAECYDKLPPGKKVLVTPLVLSDSEYAQKWQSQTYDRFNGYFESDNYKSPKGEILRSKTEMFLTKLFCEYEIPYHYEYPLLLEDGSSYRPDFYLLNKRTRKEYYWEHLGRMGDNSYANKNLKKLEVYANNGIVLGKNLIVTFETEKLHYNEVYARILIQQFLL